MSKSLTRIACAAALILSPAIATAMGCSGHEDKQAMSCASGTSYDIATGTCVPSASS